MAGPSLQAEFLSNAKLVTKKIVIVGGASGVGLAVAQAFINVRAYVTIISGDPQALKDAKAQLVPDFPQQVAFSVGDVTDEVPFRKLLQRLAPIDHLIFMATDEGDHGDLHDGELRFARHTFDTKFWGAVAVAKAVVTHNLITPGGSLSFTASSVATLLSREPQVNFEVDHALMSLTKLLASELVSKKVRLNTVLPNVASTGLWKRHGSTMEDLKARLRATGVPLAAEQEEVVEAYLYLARTETAIGAGVEIRGPGKAISIL